MREKMVIACAVIGVIIVGIAARIAWLHVVKEVLF